MPPPPPARLLQLGGSMHQLSLCLPIHTRPSCFMRLGGSKLGACRLLGCMQGEQRRCAMAQKRQGAARIPSRERLTWPCPACLPPLSQDLLHLPACLCLGRRGRGHGRREVGLPQPLLHCHRQASGRKCAARGGSTAGQYPAGGRQARLEFLGGDSVLVSRALELCMRSICRPLLFLGRVAPCASPTT